MIYKSATSWDGLCTFSMVSREAYCTALGFEVSLDPTSKPRERPATPVAAIAPQNFTSVAALPWLDFCWLVEEEEACWLSHFREPAIEFEGPRTPIGSFVGLIRKCEAQVDIRVDAVLDIGRNMMYVFGAKLSDTQNFHMRTECCFAVAV